MSDWQAELDALIKTNNLFRQLGQITDWIPPPAGTPGGRAYRACPPLANRNGSEREEIRKRVASFKAHQQRLIRDRESMPL
jgi:hypothetical protein